ncbi:MAG: ergothioneine biosynthesis protein EgtB [Candidatus Zixiibacteriota bacterium]
MDKLELVAEVKPTDPGQLIEQYRQVRQTTEKLCEPLEPDDYVIQSSKDVSPPKWHLGHTTWFFEQVILNSFQEDYAPYHPTYYFVFNSYYQTFGARLSRDLRGTLARPTVKEVYAYRAAIDERMTAFLSSRSEDDRSSIAGWLELGLHHEQQHQELLLMDVKHAFAASPLKPTYRNPDSSGSGQGAPVQDLKFVEFDGGLVEIGAPDHGFSYDNERPRHKVYVQPFVLANRLVTCGEYLDFMEDGGYSDPLLWLSDGWDAVSLNNWNSPDYWDFCDGVWMIMTLAGRKEVDSAEPVCHVSYYEAAAFARWKGKRLPTEVEWELAAQLHGPADTPPNLLDKGILHPGVACAGSSSVQQLIGDCWEWTGSAYLPYTGYVQELGALGEYNGKFMSNQMVLRGGSCVTPERHIRTTYRNFFQCDKRWPFTGFRLADSR